MIRFIGVVKRFGERTVLNEISFELGKGEILFVLGTSGTGKSVLLKSIVGLLRPEKGEIWVDGTEVSRISEDRFLSIRKTCGMVFQNPALFDSLSVYENVAFGLRRHGMKVESEIGQAVKEALALVGLVALEQKLPAELSYGMQKRVSLARTLALRPKILLFDEPTTGLDPVTTRTVNFLIHRLSRNLKTTSIVVSHDMRCALEIADRILVLDRGHIVAQGSAKELQQSDVALVKEFLKEVSVS